MKSMCGVKLVDKKLTKDLMQMLNLNQIIDELAKVSSVRCHGHGLRKDKKNILRRTFDLKVKGARKSIDQRKSS